MNETILTSRPSPEIQAKLDKQEQDREVIRMLCDCWFSSLEEGSISYIRAIREVTDMVEKNIQNGKISSNAGYILIGEYAVKCRGVPSKGPDNGIPSGFVLLLRDSKNRLSNPVRDRKVADNTVASENKNISIYERHSAKLEEYGLIISSSSLRHWLETDFPKKSKFWEARN